MSKVNWDAPHRQAGPLPHSERHLFVLEANGSESAMILVILFLAVLGIDALALIVLAALFGAEFCA